MPQIISSRTNENVKKTIKLLSSSSRRRKEGLFVLEGVRLCYDALISNYEIETLIYTPAALEKYGEKVNALITVSKKCFAVSDPVAQKISDTKTPQGLFAVCKIKNNSFELKKELKYIALDGIQNPLNLGSIIRTAEALGINGIIAGSCCDIYNPKTLRASMGSALRIPYFSTDELFNYLKQAKNAGFNIYSTVPDKSAADIKNVDFSDGGICIIGNEGNGISQNILELCENRITIKMKGKSESLNAGVAAALVMWEMTR